MPSVSRPGSLTWRSPSCAPHPAGLEGLQGALHGVGALALPLLEGQGLRGTADGAGGPRGPPLQGVPLMASG